MDCTCISFSFFLEVKAHAHQNGCPLLFNNQTDHKGRECASLITTTSPMLHNPGMCQCKQQPMDRQKSQDHYDYWPTQCAGRSPIYRSTSSNAIKISKGWQTWALNRNGKGMHTHGQRGHEHPPGTEGVFGWKVCLLKVNRTFRVQSLWEFFLIAQYEK